MSLQKLVLAVPGQILLCQCPDSRGRTYLPVSPSVFGELTLFSFPEQYKLLSDHIEQMAAE